MDTLVAEERYCNHCGEPLVRKRYEVSGKLEPQKIFERRLNCDAACANQGKRLYRDWELAEELDFLLGTDVPDSLAKRLGYSGVDSLVNRLENNGQMALRDRVMALHREYLEAGG